MSGTQATSLLRTIQYRTTNRVSSRNRTIAVLVRDSNQAHIRVNIMLQVHLVNSPTVISLPTGGQGLTATQGHISGAIPILFDGLVLSDTDGPELSSVTVRILDPIEGDVLEHNSTAGGGSLPAGDNALAVSADGFTATVPSRYNTTESADILRGIGFRTSAAYSPKLTRTIVLNVTDAGSAGGQLPPISTVANVTVTITPVN